MWISINTLISHDCHHIYTDEGSAAQPPLAADIREQGCLSPNVYPSTHAMPLTDFAVSAAQLTPPLCRLEICRPFAGHSSQAAQTRAHPLRRLTWDGRAA